MGISGRGVCEYLNVDNKHIDISMGTFTKSFGSYGGFIAGKKGIINFLRENSSFSKHSEQISPIIACHVYRSLKCIIKDKKRIETLNSNTRYMRELLIKNNFILLGNKNSPIIPILIFNPGKMGEISRLCLEKGIAIVIVGYPATDILYNRIRLCVSSEHTKKDIKKTVKILNRIGSIMGIKSK